MKVNIYDSQLKTGTPQLHAPSGPSVVPDAFGGDVARAQEGTGEALGKVAEVMAAHAEKKRQIQLEQQKYDILPKLDSELFDFQYSSQPKIIKGDDKKEYEIPTGVLNRKLTQAQGATQEFDQLALKRIEYYTDQVKDPKARTELYGLLINRYSSHRDNVIRHEAQQGNLAVQNTFKSAIDNGVKEAAIAQNPDALHKAIDGVLEISGKLEAYKGSDDETKDKNNAVNVARTVDTAVTNSLLQTGNLEQANALLDSVKNRLTLDDYDKLSRKLEQGANNIKTQLQKAQNLAKIDTRFDLLTQLTNNEIDWKNIDSIVKDVAPKDPTFGEALMRNVNFKDQYIPEDAKNLAFVSLAQKIFSTNDPKTISDFLTSALSDANISRDRLGILIGVAKNQATINNPPTPQAKEENHFLENAMALITMSIPLSAPSAIVELFKRKSTQKLSGEQIKEETKKIIREKVIGQHPVIRSLDGVPNKVISDDGQIETIYNGPNELKEGTSNGAKKEYDYRESSNEF